jgi:hypothetical protein
MDTGSSPHSYGQILDITGTVMFLSGTTYKITHDDGITVKLDGKTIISSPGPSTSPVISSFTTTTGLHSIDILYGACCGNHATLMSNLPPSFHNATVPEPGSPELMALGLVGLLAGFRRKLWR